ncbi:MAG TPA: hypothetical protein VJL60_02770 [Gammaproteobacteria bacterium]|nr:hypothetical protein [Gammaproteobacteria bacterium]
MPTPPKPDTDNSTTPTPSTNPSTTFKAPPKKGPPTPDKASTGGIGNIDPHINNPKPR